MDVFILFFTCIVTLLLGALVLLEDIHKAHLRAFAGICAAIVVWIIANYLTNHYVADLVVTNISNRIAYVSGYSVVVAGLIFTYNFPVKRVISRRHSIIVTAGVALILILSCTKLIAGEVTLVKGELIYTTPPLVGLYVLGFVGIVGLIARNLLSIPQQEEHTLQRQAKWIFYAFTVSALLGLGLNVIFPFLGLNWDTTRLGPLVTVILVVIIAYTIIRHGLFDVRLAVVRGMAYVLALVTLGGIYYLVAFGLSEIFFAQQSFVINRNPLSILLALILAFIFQPVWRFFDKATNRLFYRSNYSIDEFVIRLSRKLTMSNDMRALLLNAANDIRETLKIEQVLFAVKYKDKYVMVTGTQAHKHISNDDLSEIEKYFSKIPTDLLLTTTLSHRKDKDLSSILTHSDIAVTIPLWRAGVLLGYVFLGNKRTGYYVQRDIKALRTVKDELVIAIQNALSVEEVRDINETLKQRIEDATKELRSSNTKLRKLDAMKDEFVSMASHQLRTPLTSVKGYISMVLEGDVGKISKMQRQLLGEAFTSSERMVHLINDFLNVSRLQTGKFMIETRPVNLARVVGQEVESLQTTALAHNMKLQYRMPSHFPILYLDEGKIRQVLMNFIDNAIYYSKEHTVITVVLAVEDGNAVVSVHDTGIGVPKAEQAHLFTKFFRASNARKQRPDGTGIGLFLAKKVVDAHGGSMIFESHEGEGSTFGFRLPVKRLRTAPANDAEKLDK